MSSYFISIQNRLWQRVQAKRGAENLKPPALMNPGSEKAFTAARKALETEYLDGLMMEAHDMGVLIVALNQIGIDHKDIDINTYVTKAWESKKIDPDVQEFLDAKEVAEAEKRLKEEKSDKKQGQKLPGQKGIFDDKSEAIGGDVIREMMPKTIEELADAIEEMRAAADIAGSVLEQFFRDANFDNTKSLEEQVAAYQSVWIAVRDLWIEHNAKAENEAAPEVNEEPPVVNEIGTFMNKEPLRLTGPVLGDEDIVEAEEVTEAEEIKDPKPLASAQSADDAPIPCADAAETVTSATETQTECDKPTSSEDGIDYETYSKKKLNELRISVDEKAFELGISKDDLISLYKEAGYEPKETGESAFKKLMAVKRRLDVMKPLKKRSENKSNKKKNAASKQTPEEFEAANLIG